MRLKLKLLSVTYSHLALDECSETGQRVIKLDDLTQLVVNYVDFGAKLWSQFCISAWIQLQPVHQRKTERGCRMQASMGEPDNRFLESIFLSWIKNGLSRS